MIPTKLRIIEKKKSIKSSGGSGIYYTPTDRLQFIEAQVSVLVLVHVSELDLNGDLLFSNQYLYPHTLYLQLVNFSSCQMLHVHTLTSHS